MSTAACLDQAPVTLRSVSTGPDVRPVRPVDHECKACGGAGRCDCPHCSGTGEWYEHGCSWCHGSGVDREPCEDCGGSGEREPSCKDCGETATHKRGDTFLCAACLEDSDEH